MNPPTNNFWFHEILPLKNSEVSGVRYSLTFRDVKNPKIITELVTPKYCSAKLKSGKRIGEECGNIIPECEDTACESSIFCGRHNK
jgi:hypothetical protein